MGHPPESDYYPWGGELQLINNDTNHYKFSGKERDTESQLDYFGARHYSNGLGRFMTPDWDARPVTVPYAEFGDPQSLNLYSYVRNNPIPRVDPDGHMDADCSVCGNPDDSGFSVAPNVDPDMGAVTKEPGDSGQSIPTLPSPCSCGNNNNNDDSKKKDKKKDDKKDDKKDKKEPEKQQQENQKKEGGQQQQQQKQQQQNNQTNDTKKADDLISGSGKRSDSYHSEYGQRTYKEIKDLAKQGDQRAKQMKKLIEQRLRLDEKTSGKPR